MRFSGLSGATAVLGVSLLAYATSTGCSSDVSCGEAAAIAANQLEAVESQLGQSCTKDSDCVLAPNSTQCAPICEVVTNTAGAAQLAAAIAQINATTCARFVRGGSCEPSVAPPCAIDPSLWCVHGQCSFFPPSDDAGAGARDAAGD
jgi:hypothetical protein